MPAMLMGSWFVSMSAAKVEDLSVQSIGITVTMVQMYRLHTNILTVSFVEVYEYVKNN